MAIDAATEDRVVLPGAPAIPGLGFRLFRGDSDFPKMIAVLEASRDADKLEEVSTVERLAQAYANLKNSDPYRDLVIAEVNGEAIGYKRVEWRLETDGTRIYFHFGMLRPEWRGKGIGRAMLRHSEGRLREIAAGHPEGPKFLETWVVSTQSGLEELVASEGYTPVRHEYYMVRPDLENIPDLPLPGGLEVRPVEPEHYRAIWEAEVEAFKDHWGATEPDEQDYRHWLDGDDHFQPHLWQVAWDGDQVAGMVRNYVNAEENAKYGRRRGYTENISVRRPWRRRGLARALIARSFRMHKDLGMTEAALGVDTQNPTGALQLYESMGFQVVRSSTNYRKPL
jgi:mycothiol synthase